MNNITLKGYIKDIEPSHTIEGVEFNKAHLIAKRDNGKEDILNIEFKKFTNRYQENDLIFLKGNIRSYSYKVQGDKNKVNIYVFTYFDVPEEDINNRADIDGRICKIDPIRKTKAGKQNIHFIVANNIVSENSDKRLNSYIPCIAWGKLAKEISNLSVNTKIKLNGELHSREHRRMLDDGNYEICVAHELFVTSYEVLN